MLGLPLGLVLGFFTVGAIATAFGSWRAPFFLAAPPGLLLAVVLLRIREPARGAADAVSQTVTPVKQPVRTVLRIRTMWWLILSGVGYNFATYATGTFLVPLMQRHFHFDLRSAAITAGVVLGLSGLIAMTCGGFLADAAHKRNDRGRLWLSAAAMLFAAVATWAALRSSSATGFVALFGIGWLLAYLYSLCIYPVIQELVVPRLRATAMAVYFAAMYVLGGAFGSIVVGAYSDHIANSLMVRDGLQVVSEGNRAAGLHGALVLVPLALLVTAFACWMAGRTLRRDMALAKG
jgi:MFS family permease